MLDKVAIEIECQKATAFRLTQNEYITKTLFKICQN